MEGKGSKLKTNTRKSFYTTHSNLWSSLSQQITKAKSQVSEYGNSSTEVTAVVDVTQSVIHSFFHKHCIIHLVLLKNSLLTYTKELRQQLLNMLSKMQQNEPI